MKKTNKKVLLEIGKCYFFRTVTYHTVGKVIAVIGNFVKLSDASWIAASGRFMQAIKDGMRTMAEDGFIKAAQGLTSIEEVLRVIMD